MKKRFSLIAMFALLVTVLASCASKYTIEFVEKNGTEIYEAIEVREGEVVELPADPTKDGLTFAGWYTNPGFTKEFAAGSVMPAESLVLYAKWVATLTFDSKGGTECSSITAVPGTAIELPTSTKEGYAFAGWFTDEAGTKAQTIVMPKVHTTVYAKWQVPNPNTAYEFGNIRDNDGNAYDIAQNNGEITVTAKETKGSWSFFYDNINIDASGYRIVEFTIVGTKDCKAIFKLQNGALADGSGVHATEIPVIMTGEEQKVTWVVNTNNLTASGGQMFLVFLNAGNDGWVKTPAAAEGEQPVKFEAAPYVTFKSVALYEAVDPGTTSDKYAIHFDSNGADPIESIVATKGAPVTLPTPTREGYKFVGWFTNAALTGDVYTTETMPEEAVRLFACWEKLVADPKTVDLLADTYVFDATADPHTVKYENGVLSVQKSNKYEADGTTLAGNEWSCVKTTLTGKDIAGMSVLKVTLKGAKDAKVLLKINNKLEKWVTTTGETQVLEFPFELEFDNNAAALIVFAGGGTKGESAAFEFTQLEFANYRSVVSVLADAYQFDATADPHTVKYENGVLSVQKSNKYEADGTTLAGNEWSCVKTTLTGADIVGMNTLRATVKGAQGAKVLLKINNKIEKWVECTGETQVLSFPFELEVDKAAPALIVFAGAGNKGESAVFEFTQLEFVASTSLLADTYVFDATADPHTVKFENGVLSVQKSNKYEADGTTLAGNEWSCIKTTIKGQAIAGMTTLKVTVKGAQGAKVLFKINNKVEKWVECTGETQVLEFDYQLELDKEAPALIIFAGAGNKGESAVFEITNLEFTR